MSLLSINSSDSSSYPLPSLTSEWVRVKSEQIAMAAAAAAIGLIHNSQATLFPFPENVKRRRRRKNIIINLNPMRTRGGEMRRLVVVAASAESGGGGGDRRRVVAMETAGAYQLIDDETGDKYIVWGGDDDHSSSSSIPSNHLLSWTPPDPISQQESTRKTTTTTTTTTTASFGRLKAQRVNHLVRRITKKKQQLNNLHHHAQPSPSNEDLSAPSPPTRDMLLMQQQDTGSTREDVSVSRPSSNASLSTGWGDGRITQHYASKMDHLSERWHKSNDKTNFFSRKTFKDLGCTDYVIQSLRAQHYQRPSHIQAMAFGPVIGGKSCIIADQSGSGKTLAYLLPLVQQLREEELQGLGKPLSQSPRVVILVPTAELASQVLSVCRSLSKSGVPFRSMVMTGGFRQRTQLENLRQELDILIATPGRLLFLIKEGFLQLTNLKSAVLDEVDVLFNDEDFELALECLVNVATVSTQYLFVTATLPVPIYNKLIEAFPDSDVIMGPGIHCTSPGLVEILVDCSGDDNTEKTPETAFLNKKIALQKLVEESPVSRTIIFCNKIETCRKVENMLKRFDRKGSCTRVLPFHAALDQKARVANINEFRSSQSKNSSLFLVCTDRASRGIDFAGVDHVVLFDFPRDPSEYVRRVGRTARGAGGEGKAFIFVVGKQVSLAQRIIERNRKGHPLHDVPSEFD